MLHFYCTLPPTLKGRFTDILKTAEHALYYSLNKLGEVGENVSKHVS